MKDNLKKFEQIIEFGKLINSSYDYKFFKKKSVAKIKEFMPDHKTRSRSKNSPPNTDKLTAKAVDKGTPLIVIIVKPTM